MESLWSASRYPSDLSDAEWALLEPHLVVSGGRPLKYSLREIANAVFYRLRTGCQWRYLPRNSGARAH